MQDASTAPRRGLYALALAALVAAVAALSTWVAADPAPAQQSTAPTQFIQTPEGGATPEGEAAPEGESDRSGRPPCPEDEGDQGGSGSSQDEGASTPAV